jgi:hypothetical protein
LSEQLPSPSDRPLGKLARPDRQPAANEKPGNRPGLSRENVQVMKREEHLGHKMVAQDVLY